MSSLQDDQKRPEDLELLPGVTGDKVEKTYSQGNTGGLLIDPEDGTIGEADRALGQALHERVRENEQMLNELEHPQPGGQPAQEQALGAPSAPPTPAGSGISAGTNVDQAGELPNSSTGAVGVGRAGMGAGGGRGRGGGSQGNSPSGGVAVNPGRGSDVGMIGPTTRDDLGGGMSGGTTGGARERDTGGGLSGAPRNDMGSGRDPDLDSVRHPREQRPVGTQADDQPKE